MCFSLFETRFLAKNMIVDLSKFEGAFAVFQFELSPADIEFEIEELKLAAAAIVSARVEKHIAQTNVDGEISTKIENNCNRCLKKVENDLEFPFTAIFVSPENYTKQNEKKLSADELEVSVIDSEEIDMSELIREQILLALPTQFLCREDCKGLCPVCGSNKNLIDCKCIEKEIDPRWSDLKNINIG